MTRTPRHFSRTCAALFLVSALAASPALAQTRTGDARRSTRTPSKNAEQAARKRDDESLRRRQRQQAIAALREAADAARSFEDDASGVEVQTLAADALWRFDEPTARIIFRRAWDAATKADKNRFEETSRTLRQPEAWTFTSLREEVLPKVAARDTRMAGVFLQEMLDDKRRFNEEQKSGGTPDNESRTPSSSSLSRRYSEDASSRLSLSQALLNRGEAERAAEILAPVVDEGVSGSLIDVLLNLRRQSANHADALYSRLLQRARAGGANEADANTVLLLSTYVVSPQLFIVVTQGSIETSVRWGDDGSGADPSPIPAELRAAFYELAAAVLVRRSRTADADSNPADNLAAQFFAVERLLPFFEREAVQHAPALRAAREALANEMEASRRELLSSQSELRSLKSQNPTDPLASLLDRLARESDAAARDPVRISIVDSATRRKLWERALNYAAEIEDADARRAAFTFIAVKQIENLSNSFAESQADDYERAATFVRGADVPHAARAWGFAQAATLAAQRKQRARAVELLDEATRYAGSVETGTDERAAAFAVVTKAAAQIDAARAWESLASLVRAANALEDLTTGELEFDVVLASEPVETRQALGGDFTIEAGAFRIDEVFAKMARLDAERTLAATRTLAGKEPRAYVTVAAARAILENFDDGRDGATKRRRSSVR